MEEKGTDNLESETGDDTTSTNGDKPSYETLEFQKRKMKEQRDEARAEIEKLKATHETAKPAVKVETSNDGVTDKLTEIEFALAHKDLEGSDIKEVIAIAKGKGVSYDEAYDSTIFQAYLKEKKSSTLKDTPSSTRSPRSESEKPVKEMSRDEHIEHWKKTAGNG